MILLVWGKKHVHFLKTFRSTLARKNTSDLKVQKIFLSKQIEKLLEILVKKFMPKYAFDQTSGTHFDNQTLWEVPFT